MRSTDLWDSIVAPVNRLLDEAMAVLNVQLDPERLAESEQSQVSDGTELRDGLGQVAAPHPREPSRDAGDAAISAPPNNPNSHSSASLGTMPMQASPAEPEENPMVAWQRTETDRHTPGSTRTADSDPTAPVASSTRASVSEKAVTSNSTSRPDASNSPAPSPPLPSSTLTFEQTPWVDESNAPSRGSVVSSPMGALSPSLASAAAKLANSSDDVTVAFTGSDTLTGPQADPLAGVAVPVTSSDALTVPQTNPSANVAMPFGDDAAQPGPAAEFISPNSTAVPSASPIGSKQQAKGTSSATVTVSKTPLVTNTASPVSALDRKSSQVPLRPASADVSALPTNQPVNPSIPSGARVRSSGASTDSGLSPPAKTSYPPRDLRRNAQQIVSGMEPVFDQAYASTTNAFDQMTESVTADASHVAIPRVNNTFNVHVALGGTQGEVPDPTALEEALVELLRTAARRQGLEV